jgi:serine protease AprX
VPQLVTVREAALLTSLSHSSIAYISPNRAVRGSLDKAVRAVNGDLAYASGWDGTGIGIAVIDSGVSSAYDLNSDNNLSSRIAYSQSFVPGDTSTADDFGHGTHIAGIIGGNAYTSSTSNYQVVYRGVAPEANIINLRALDSTGAGTDSSVIAAIQQAISQKYYHIRVINLSGAGSIEATRLTPRQAVESAWRAGLVVVVTVGNMGQYNGAGTSGHATIGAPGNDPYVITWRDCLMVQVPNSATMTSYSSKVRRVRSHRQTRPRGRASRGFARPRRATARGVPAPGRLSVQLFSNQLRLAIRRPLHAPQHQHATPLVSGVAALLLRKTPSLTPDQVRPFDEAFSEGFSTKRRRTRALATPQVHGIRSLWGRCRGPHLPHWPVRISHANVGAAKSPTTTYNSLTHYFDRG